MSSGRSFLTHKPSRVPSRRQEVRRWFNHRDRSRPTLTWKVGGFDETAGRVGLRDLPNCAATLRRQQDRRRRAELDRTSELRHEFRLKFRNSELTCRLLRHQRRDVGRSRWRDCAGRVRISVVGDVLIADEKASTRQPYPFCTDGFIIRQFRKDLGTMLLSVAQP